MLLFADIEGGVHTIEVNAGSDSGVMNLIQLVV